MLSPDLQRIEHIRDYCCDIEKAVNKHGASFEEFEEEMEFQYSVSFCLLQIGELVGGFTKEFREATSKRMPWGPIKGMRNMVAHGYGSMSHDILWETITVDIPNLKAYCDELLFGSNQ